MLGCALSVGKGGVVEREIKRSPFDCGAELGRKWSLMRAWEDLHEIDLS